MTETATPTYDRMSNAARALSEIDAQIAALVADIKKLPIEEAFIQYHHLKSAYERIDNVRKAMGEKVDDLKNRALPEMLTDKKINTISVEIEPGLSYRFSKSLRWSCSMTDKIAGPQWLRDNGHEGLITETVNSSSLSSFAKQYIQEQGMDLPEAIFKVSTMNFISGTKV